MKQKNLSQSDVLHLIHLVQDESSLACARDAVAQWFNRFPNDLVIATAAESLAYSAMMTEHPEKFAPVSGGLL